MKSETRSWKEIEKLFTRREISEREISEAAGFADREVQEMNLRAPREAAGKCQEQVPARRR